MFSDFFKKQITTADMLKKRVNRVERIAKDCHLTVFYPLTPHPNTYFVLIRDKESNDVFRAPTLRSAEAFLRRYKRERRIL